ncbi:unnamed protein product [Rotaria magnacalcarata]
MIENGNLVESGEQTNESTAKMSSTSSLEMMPSTTTVNAVNNNQYSFNVDQIGVKRRLIEQLIGSCQDLIKQSTSIDLCIETFAKNSNGFADALIQTGNDLKCLCTNIVSTIESNRNKITITELEEDKIVNRDPCYYKCDHKFTEEQLRYLVSVGSFQTRLYKFPKNKALNAAKTTYMFSAAWYDEYPYIEYRPGTEKKEQAWISTGVSSWNKMKSKGVKRKGKLDIHFSSVTHRSSVERYLNYKTKKVNINLMLDSSRRKANQEQESILQLNK